MGTRSQKLSPFPKNASNPYYLEKSKKNRVALKLRNAEKLKKTTRKLTRKLLKPQIVSDKLLAESDAEFAWCEDLHQDSVNNPMLLLKAAAAADAAQLSRQDRTRPLIADLDCYKNYELRAEWMDSDDEWECGRWMVCRRRGLDNLEQLNLDLCEEDFQKLRKPEPLVTAWQWFDNETEQLDCAPDLDQAIDKYNSTTINDIGWKADRISDVNVPDRICLAAHENYLSGHSLDTRLFQGQSWDTYFE